MTRRFGILCILALAYAGDTHAQVLAEPYTTQAVVAGMIGAIPPYTAGTNVSIAGKIISATTIGSMSSTTGSIGGSLLLAAGCTSGATTVAGAVVGMVTTATPNVYPGDGVQWQSYVSGANTVTVKVCALIALAPGASTYNVRVIP